MKLGPGTTSIFFVGSEKRPVWSRRLNSVQSARLDGFLYSFIEFKLLLLTYKSLQQSAPHYLQVLLHPYVPHPSLCSSSTSWWRAHSDETINFYWSISGAPRHNQGAWRQSPCYLFWSCWWPIACIAILVTSSNRHSHICVNQSLDRFIHGSRSPTS